MCVLQSRWKKRPKLLVSGAEARFERSRSQPLPNHRQPRPGNSLIPMISIKSNERIAAGDADDAPFPPQPSLKR
jgi:hypothetical protein